MDLFIKSDGAIVCVYDEAIDLASLGVVSIRRASHVEPDASGGGGWWVDLAPVGGPRLGPFDRRSQALAAERAWLGARLGVEGLAPPGHLPFLDSRRLLGPHLCDPGCPFGAAT